MIWVLCEIDELLSIKALRLINLMCMERSLPREFLQNIVLLMTQIGEQAICSVSTDVILMFVKCCSTVLIAWFVVVLDAFGITNNYTWNHELHSNPLTVPLSAIGFWICLSRTSVGCFGHLQKHRNASNLQSTCLQSESPSISQSCVITSNTINPCWCVACSKWSAFDSIQRYDCNTV